MQPAPIPLDDPARLEALVGLEVLDTPPEPVFDQITQLVAGILDVPIALVSLVDRDRQWFKSRYGIDAPQTPRDISFCGHVVAAHETLVVEDASQDPRFADNPLVTSAPDIRFYAGVALTGARGHKLGTLCAIDRVPRSLTPAQLELLRLLAAQVENALLMRRRLLQRDRLAAILRTSADVLAVGDRDGRIHFANPAAQRVLGGGAGRLLDLHAPDSWDVLSTEAVPQALAGRPWRGEAALADEARTPVLEVLLGSPPTDQSAGFLAVHARDVSELKRVQQALSTSREELQAIVDNVSDAVIVCDVHGRVVRENPASRAMFGEDRPALAHRLHGADGPIRTPAELAAHAGQELDGAGADGHRFRCGVSIGEHGGTDPLFVVVVRDRTEIEQRRQAEEALRAREAHRRGAIESSSAILHDLGNALTGVAARAVDARAVVADGVAARHLTQTGRFLRSNGDALADALGARKAAALVELVEAAAEDVTQTSAQAAGSLDKCLAYLSHAQELLTVHRSYSGAGSGPVTEFLDLRRLLDDAVLMCVDAVHKRGGRITAQCGPGIELTAERTRIMQVLLNLIRNATEALDGAPPESDRAITIVGTRDRDAVRITIQDTGEGFAPDADPFAEGYTTRTRGSGIGLSSVWSIVADMGGTVSLTSPGPGRGARAALVLPSRRPRRA